VILLIEELMKGVEPRYAVKTFTNKDFLYYLSKDEKYNNQIKKFNVIIMVKMYDFELLIMLFSLLSCHFAAKNIATIFPILNIQKRMFKIHT
jgi:thiaminase